MNNNSLYILCLYFFVDDDPKQHWHMSKMRRRGCFLNSDIFGENNGNERGQVVFNTYAISPDLIFFYFF